MKTSRSPLVLGMAGAAFFLVAGIYGLTREPSVLWGLFVLIGLVGLIGGAYLWRSIGKSGGS